MRLKLDQSWIHAFILAIGLVAFMGNGCPPEIDPFEPGPLPPDGTDQVIAPPTGPETEVVEACDACHGRDTSWNIPAVHEDTFRLNVAGDPESVLLDEGVGLLLTPVYPTTGTHYVVGTDAVATVAVDFLTAEGSELFLGDLIEPPYIASCEITITGPRRNYPGGTGGPPFEFDPSRYDAADFFRGAISMQYEIVCDAQNMPGFDGETFQVDLPTDVAPAISTPLPDPGNIGDGSLGASLAILDPNAMSYDRWTIQITDASMPGAESFSVAGMLAGDQGPGTVGSPWTNGVFSFTLAPGATDFAIGDGITFDTRGDASGSYTALGRLEVVYPSGRRLTASASSIVQLGTVAIDVRPQADRCSNCHTADSRHAYGVASECAVCHTPGMTFSRDGRLGFPEHPLHLAAMVHKIHNYPNLPSTNDADERNDYRLYDASAGTHVLDPSVMAFPRPAKDCLTCHEDTAWKSNISRAACKTCHEDVDFVNAATGHPPQPNDSLCIHCHGPGEFKAVERMHFPLDMTPGLVMAVAPSAPANGQFFTAGDPPAFLLSFMETDGTPLAAGQLDRLAIYVSGPADAPALIAIGRGSDTVVANILDASGNVAPAYVGVFQDEGGGTYSYVVPEAATQESGIYMLAAEAWTVGDVNGATASTSFNVGASNVPGFNEFVTIDKCNTCHGSLTQHAESRRLDECRTCHQPGDLFPSNRTVSDDGDVQLDFAWMIHRLHSGNLDLLAEDGSPQPYLGMSFVKPLNDCTQCHVNDNHEDLPSGRNCLSCHNSSDAAVHAAANTEVVELP